eukprot:Lankesteria_metandrocarpae@DN4763_c0_g1_i3.p1
MEQQECDRSQARAATPPTPPTHDTAVPPLIPSTATAAVVHLSQVDPCGTTITPTAHSHNYHSHKVDPQRDCINKSNTNQYDSDHRQQQRTQDGSLTDDSSEHHDGIASNAMKTNPCDDTQRNNPNPTSKYLNVNSIRSHATPASFCSSASSNSNSSFCNEIDTAGHNPRTTTSKVAAASASSTAAVVPKTSTVYSPVRSSSKALQFAKSFLADSNRAVDVVAAKEKQLKQTVDARLQVLNEKAKNVASSATSAPSTGASQQQAVSTATHAKHTGSTDYERWSVLEHSIRLEDDIERLEEEADAEAKRKELASIGCSHDHTKERLVYEKTTEEKLHASNRFRLEGNSAFREKNYGLAAVNYRKALLQLDYCFPDTEEERKRFEVIKLSCHLNLAACKIHQQDWDECLTQCRLALEVDNKNAKALYRRGMAYLNLDSYDNAEKAFRAAESSDPSSTAVQQALRALVTKRVQYNKKNKSVCAAMFGAASGSPTEQQRGSISNSKKGEQGQTDFNEDLSCKSGESTVCKGTHTTGNINDNVTNNTCNTVSNHVGCDGKVLNEVLTDDESDVGDHNPPNTTTATAVNTPTTATPAASTSTTDLMSNGADGSVDGTTVSTATLQNTCSARVGISKNSSSSAAATFIGKETLNRNGAAGRNHCGGDSCQGVRNTVAKNDEPVDARSGGTRNGPHTHAAAAVSRDGTGVEGRLAAIRSAKGTERNGTTHNDRSDDCYDCNYSKKHHTSSTNNENNIMSNYNNHGTTDTWSTANDTSSGVACSSSVTHSISPTATKRVVHHMNSTTSTITKYHTAVTQDTPRQTTAKPPRNQRLSLSISSPRHQNANVMSATRRDMLKNFQELHRVYSAEPLNRESKVRSGGDYNEIGITKTLVHTQEIPPSKRLQGNSSSPLRKRLTRQTSETSNARTSDEVLEAVAKLSELLDLQRGRKHAKHGGGSPGGDRTTEAKDDLWGGDYGPAHDDEFGNDGMLAWILGGCVVMVVVLFVVVLLVVGWGIRNSSPSPITRTATQLAGESRVSDKVTHIAHDWAGGGSLWNDTSVVAFFVGVATFTLLCTLGTCAFC